MEPPPPQRFFRRALGSAVLMAWLVTGLRLGSVAFILPFMLRRLPPEELGLWFVLLNASQLFLFLEMSFQFSLSRAASYLLAGAQDLAALGVGAPPAEGAEPNWPQLRAMLRTGGRFYLVLAGGVVILTLLGAGGWLAWTRPTEFLRPRSLLTFGLLCVSGPLGLTGLQWNAYLSGLNRVREAQVIQLRALAANYLVAFVGLMAGAGLVALALAQVVMVVISRLESRRLVRQEFPELLAPAEADFPWLRLWPTTWRTGAVQLGAYLILPASLLICGQFLDLRTTAAYGLSVQAVALLHGLAASWLTVKYPVLSQWIAAGRLEDVRALFRQRLALGMLTFAAGAIFALVLGPSVLRWIGSQTPLLSTGLLAGLLAVVMLDLFIALWGSLILAANRTDHLLSLLTAGGVNVVLGCWWAPTHGVAGLIVAMLCGYLVLHAWRTPWQAWRLVSGKPAS